MSGTSPFVTSETHQRKLCDRRSDQYVRPLHRKHGLSAISSSPERLPVQPARILDRERHVLQDPMQPLLRLDRPVDADPLESRRDTAVVEETFGQDAEELRDDDEAAEDGCAVGRLGEHALGRDELVVDRRGERADALEVVDQHRRARDGACSGLSLWAGKREPGRGA